jgi:DivIVA domain-containing protein
MGRDYDEGEVDAFLERVEQELRNPQAVGGLTAADMHDRAFSRVERGYDPGEVDAFFERVAQQFRNPQAVGGLTADDIHNVAFTSRRRRWWSQRSSNNESPFLDALFDFFFRSWR